MARAPIDMRRSFDGLVAEVIATIDQDPQSGHLFVFFNKRRDMVKSLVWDGSGYWIHYKRLEHGRFHAFDRATSGRSIELRGTDLSLLLSGIDLRGAKRRLSHDEIMRTPPALPRLH